MGEVRGNAGKGEHREDMWGIKSVLEPGPPIGGAEGVTVRGHRGTRGSELSGLECKIHQLKLRPAAAMMLFFDFGPKFEHPRTL